MLLAWGSPTVLPHWNGLADSRPNSLVLCYPAWLPSCLEQCRCHLTSGHWECVVKGDDTSLLEDPGFKNKFQLLTIAIYDDRKGCFFLSYQCESKQTVKPFIQSRLDNTKIVWYMFYCVTVQVCLMQKASEECFYWSNRYYTGIIAHEGTSYGGIHSSRSLRFTAYKTKTPQQTSKSDMETNAPLPPLIVPHGSLYVCTHGR